MLAPPLPHLRPTLCLPLSLPLQVEFGQIYLSKPIFIEADGETAVLFPKEARLRNLTYAAPLYVDIERRDKVVHPDGTEEVEVMPYPKVYLGDVSLGPLWAGKKRTGADCANMGPAGVRCTPVSRWKQLGLLHTSRLAGWQASLELIEPLCWLPGAPLPLLKIWHGCLGDLCRERAQHPAPGRTCPRSLGPCRCPSCCAPTTAT